MIILQSICAALWLFLAAIFWIRSIAISRTVRVWGITACLLAASAAIVRWHVVLWQQTRALLREAELYASRGLFKLGIAALLIVLAALLAESARRVLRSSGTVGLIPIGVSAWLLWLLAWTSFLDNLLPPTFGEPPLRYGIEIAWALMMMMILLLAQRGKAR